MARPVGRDDKDGALRRGHRYVTPLFLMVAILLIAAAPAGAATVSGALKNGKGYRVIAVQPSGVAKKLTITRSSGAFAIKGVKLAYASLHLVRADGTYFGPVVLKASGAKAYEAAKGTADLDLGKVVLKRGYALVAKMPAGRCSTKPFATARAVNGRPIGAGKLGRVRTGEPMGYRGQGADLDRDGIIGAFDIDDNGNLILDNVDGTGRGSSRPVARSSGGASSFGRVAPRDDAPGGVPELTELRLFSNFKLGDATSINVNIPGLTNVDGLIAEYVPSTITLAMPVLGGATAQLDGLGNPYMVEHVIGGITYPQVNGGPPAYSGALLQLATGVTRDAQIMPGASPEEIAAGDAFVETAIDGVNYPGVLNFVFNTAPALVSYQFDTDPAPTTVVYDGSGVSQRGMTPETAKRLQAPAGATTVTLTWWRPQRRATTGETGDAAGWIDVGGLRYRCDIPNAARVPGGGAELPGSHSARDAYVSAAANGTPIAVTSDDGIIDPAVDAPANAANTVSFTVSLPKCFSEWASFPSGTEFDFDIQALSWYGDNAARKLYFVKL
jgi:hypothetical protein